jgi:hypothetical protein
VTVTPDDFAANRDTGYEGFEGGQGHRAAVQSLVAVTEGLVELRRIDPVQAHAFPRDNDCVAVDDPRSTDETFGVLVRPRQFREAGEEAFKHSSTEFDAPLDRSSLHRSG